MVAIVAIILAAQIIAIPSNSEVAPRLRIPVAPSPDLHHMPLVRPEGVSIHMSYVGRYGIGPAYSLVKVGDRVYVGDSDTLDSVDVSSPSRPSMKARLPGIGYFLDVEPGPEGVLFAGNYLGAGIIDLESPDDIWYYSVWVPPEETYGNYVTFDVSYDPRGYLYVAVTGGGVGILDVSDPADPVEIAHIEAPTNMYAFSVFCSSNLLAIGWVPAMGSGKVDVYDVSDPRTPAYSWTYQESLLEPYSVAIKDGYLLIATADKFMVVDMDSHEKVAELDVQNDVQKMRIFGDTVLLPFYFYTPDLEYGGVTYVDVSDPANPQVLGVYSGGAGSFDAWLDGTTIYLADGSGGLLVLDASNPGNMRRIGKLDTPDLLYYVDQVNGYPVVSNPNSGILVFDPYSNPDFPQIASQIFIPPVQSTFSWDISASGDLLYVSTVGGGVRIYNLSNPQAPVSVGSFSVPSDYVFDVFADGDTAYVGAMQNGVIILNVSDPSSPSVYSRVDLWGAGYEGELVGLAESGGVVAVGMSHKILVQELPWKGIIIIDATDPENPRITANVTLAQMGVTGDIWDVAMEGNLVFFSIQGPSRDQPGWIGIMDVSDPENPRMLSLIEADYFPFGISVQGTYLYTAQVRVGVEIYDVSDPSNPAFYDIYYPGFAIDVEPCGPRIFASHVYAGLYHLAYDQGPPEVTVTSPPDGSYLNTADVTIEWQGQDDTKIIAYYVSVDGSDYQYVDRATSYTASGLEEGAHGISVLARDAANNYGQATVSFIVDLTPPIVEITSPQEGQVFATNTVTVEWEAHEEVALDHVEVSLDGGEPIDVGLATNYTFTGIPEGDHQVVVTAYDKAGNSASDTVHFSIVPPFRLTITSPEEGARLNSSEVTVVWEFEQVNPDEPLDHFEVVLDDGEPVVIEDTTARSYTLTGVPDGDHVVTVSAVSVHGISISDSISFSVDSTPPVVEIVEPAEDSYLPSGDVTVRWTYEEPNLDHFELSVDGGSWINVGTETEYTVQGLEEGDHSVSVRGVDTYGNVGDPYSVSFYVDLTAPQVEITEPEDGTYTNEVPVTVRWTYEELYLDHFEVSVDGGDWQDVGTETQYLAFLEDGTHTVAVKAVDKVGRESTDSVTFTVDTTPPQVTITQPEAGAYLPTQLVAVSWSGSDNIGIDHYEIRVDGGDWQDVGTATTTTFQLQDGQHSVEVKALDRAGNEARASIVFTVDTTPPVVQVLSPAPGSYVNTSLVTVTWQAEEANLDHFEVSVDGGDWQDVGTSTTYTATLMEGSHSISVKAVDKAGNEGTATTAFVVDTTPPILSISSPENGAYLGTSTVSISWSCDENHLDHFEISVDEGAWQVLGTATSTTLSLGDGSHTVAVRAVDLAGNTATATVSFVVDTTKPVITISSPTQGQKVGKTVTVYWNITEENLEKVEISLDGGAWQDVTGMTSYTFSNLPGGDHTVTIRVTDKAGNQATASVSFTVSVIPWLYIIIAIVVIVVVVAVLLLRKK